MMSPDLRPSPLKLSFNRWVDVVCYATVAATVWILAGAMIPSTCSPIVRVLGGIPFWQLAGSLVALTGVVVWRGGRGRWSGFLGATHFYSYPPLWVAVVLGWGGVSILDPNVASTWPRYAGVLGLLVGAVVAGIRVLRNSRRRTESDERMSGAFVGQDPLTNSSDLIRWIADDDVIDEPALDRFGHDLVARRIVRRLASEQTSEAPTIALVGALGSGKSSIRALVQWRLKNNPRLCIVNLSLWPFESSEAAIGGILSKLLKELSRHVNTTAISGFPDSYLAAVERLGGPWHAVGRLLRRDSDPESILKQFSNVAQAIGLQVVLWIEDIERFSGEGHESNQHPKSADSERLGPIRALLYLLDQCPSISVVVAGTSLRSRFDLNKIARFVESPPTVKTDRAWEAIRALQASCLERTIIDPADPKARQDMAPGELVLNLSSPAWRYELNQPTFHQTFALLLQTPRSLKDALRITHDAWKVLAGEIDLDDILVISVIRAARPRIFAFVDEHIDVFRTGFKSRRDEHARTGHPKYKEFETLLSAEESVDHQKAVLVLLSHVFPMPEDRMQTETERWYMEKPQGLAVDRHVDYWCRYHSVPEIDPEESDQAALHEIESWQKKEPNSLVDRLTDRKKCGQIETFVGQFRGEDLVRLLEEVVEKLKDTDIEYGWRSDEPGIIPVWRMMAAQGVDSGVLTVSLVRLIKQLIAVNLPLVQELLDFMTAPESASVSALLESKDVRHTRSTVCAELESQFQPGAGRKLVDAMRHGPPYTLYRLCWASDRIDEGSTDGAPFEGWSAFSEVLLEAATLEPSVGLGQILPFVTDVSESTRHVINRGEGGGISRTLSGTFNENKAKSLFNIERLLRLVRDVSIDLEYSVRTTGEGRTDAALRVDTAERLKAAKAFAEQYFRSNPSGE